MKNENLNINKDKFWFIGPNAENLNLFKEFIVNVFEDHCYWRKNFHSKELLLIKESERSSEEFQRVTALFKDNLNELTNRLKTSVPQFSSRYLGHMLPDPTFPATLGSFLGMLINNNNTSEESSPTTLSLEFEALRMICQMFNYGRHAWGHLTSGGTGANVHCLWRARDLAFYPYVLALGFTKGSQSVKTSLSHIKLPKRGGLAEMLETKTLGLLTIDERIELLTQVLEQGTKHHDLLPGLREFSAYHIGLEGFFKLARSTLGHNFPKNFRFVVNKAAHYSIFKAANLLGFGKQHIVPINLDETSSMDIAILEQKIRDIFESQEAIVAVVNIFGSTELGNIDNIQDIVDLRERIHKENLGTFWLHTDAAWGGYFTALLHDGIHKKHITNRGLQNYLHTILQELFKDAKEIDKDLWDDKIELWTNHFLRAANAIHYSDSITVDPHKSGYIPYPAGACLFKNYLVREIITYRFNYVNAKKFSPEKEMEIIWTCPLLAQYTIDGSRPSSPAVAIWLAHKTIPLDNLGHGILIAKMVLASMYLQEVLSREVITDNHEDTVQYVFMNRVPLTGIVCYTLKINYQGRTISLKEVNQIMDAIYHETTLDKNANIYEKHFFLSFTKLTGENYVNEANQFLVKNEIPGRVIDYQQPELAFDPWEDDDHLALFRNVTINPFFLIHKVLSKDNEELHLAKDYALYLAQKILLALDVVAHDKGTMSHHYQLPCKVLILEDGKVLGELIRDHIQSTYNIANENILICRDSVTAWNLMLRFRIETAVLGVDLGPEKEKEGIGFLERISRLPFFRGAVLFTYHEEHAVATDIARALKRRPDWLIYYLQHFDLEEQNINYTFRRLVSLLWKVAYNSRHQGLTHDELTKNISQPTKVFFDEEYEQFLRTLQGVAHDTTHPLTVIASCFSKTELKKYYLFLENLFIFKPIYRIYLHHDENDFRQAFTEFAMRFFMSIDDKAFIESVFACWKKHDLPWYLYEKRGK